MSHKKNSQQVTLDTSKINEEQINQYKMSMSSDAIPSLQELDNMMENLNDLILFIETPTMKNLENTNKNEFERIVFGKYNSVLQMRMIHLLIDDKELRYDNLDQLLDMLVTMQNIKKGNKNVQEEYEKFSNKLTEKYVYSNYKGNTLEEKKQNFEKEIMKNKKTNS